MTKADLINAVSQQTDISKDEATNVVELVLATIKENLADGKTLKIAGFGTFLVRKKAERKARNLKTNEEIILPPRRVVTFKASQHFKTMVENV